MSRYFLGKIITMDKCWTGDPIVEISEAEKNEYYSNISFAPFFYSCRQIKNITIESGNDFVEYSTKLANTSRVFSEQEMVGLLTSANKLLISYLSFVKTFNDIVSKNIAQKKGEKQLSDYKKENSAMYDKYFSYRFLSRLRNYVIHYAIPLTSIKSDKLGVEFECTKSELLKYDGWSKIKAEIEAKPEKMQCIQYVCECNNVNDSLYLYALSLILDEVSTGSISLRNKLEKYGDNMFAIGEEKKGTITWSKLPLHLFKEYIDDFSRNKDFSIQFDN